MLYHRFSKLCFGVLLGTSLGFSGYAMEAQKLADKPKSGKIYLAEPGGNRAGMYEIRAYEIKRLLVLINREIWQLEVNGKNGKPAAPGKTSGMGTLLAERGSEMSEVARKPNYVQNNLLKQLQREKFRLISLLRTMERGRGTKPIAEAGEGDAQLAAQGKAFTKLRANQTLYKKGPLTSLKDVSVQRPTVYGIARHTTLQLVNAKFKLNTVGCHLNNMDRLKSAAMLRATNIK